MIWRNGGVTDIGNLGAGFWNTPTAINQQGVVAGFAGDPAFPEGDLLHAFIWTESGGIQALPELPGHVYSEASGVNADGTAVGISCDPDFVDCRAVRWDDGVVTDLNELKQGDFAPRLEIPRTSTTPARLQDERSIQSLECEQPSSLCRPTSQGGTLATTFGGTRLGESLR